MLHFLAVMTSALRGWLWVSLWFLCSIVLSAVLFKLLWICTYEKFIVHLRNKVKVWTFCYQVVISIYWFFCLKKHNSNTFSNLDWTKEMSSQVPAHEAKVVHSPQYHLYRMAKPSFSFFLIFTEIVLTRFYLFEKVVTQPYLDDMCGWISMTGHDAPCFPEFTFGV
jgi:hypothetical protein